MNKTKHDTIQVANSKLEHHCIEVKLSYKVYEVLCLDDLALVGGMGERDKRSIASSILFVLVQSEQVSIVESHRQGNKMGRVAHPNERFVLLRTIRQRVLLAECHQP